MQRCPWFGCREGFSPPENGFFFHTETATRPEGARMKTSLFWLILLCFMMFSQSVEEECAPLTWVLFAEVDLRNEPRQISFLNQDLYNFFCSCSFYRWIQQ